MGLTINAQSGAILWSDNQWYTLDYLQKEVAKRTGQQIPHGAAFEQSANEQVQIVGNCGLEEMAKALGPELEAIELRNHMASQEPHLPLPRMNFNKASQLPPKQTFNQEGDQQEHLPVPQWSTRRD